MDIAETVMDVAKYALLPAALGAIVLPAAMDQGNKDVLMSFVALSAFAVGAIYMEDFGPIPQIRDAIPIF